MVNIDELIIKETPAYTLSGGEFPDGYGNTILDPEHDVPAYTTLRAVSPITAPELREKVTRAVPDLKKLLELETAGQNPSGVELDVEQDFGGRPVDPKGLFHTALTHTIHNLLAERLGSQRETWSSGPFFSVSLEETAHGTEEVHISIAEDKETVRDLIESGRLNIETFSVDKGVWPADGIEEAFNECLGSLVYSHWQAQLHHD
jgi:hypothetical protein